MKKYTVYKTIQLVLFIALAAVAVFVVFPDADIYHRVANDPVMMALAVVVWVSLGISFLFIFLDYHFFFGYRKEYREMEYAAHSDPVSGIANRFSCDMMIEKYMDRELPEKLGCIMFDLTNIQEINRLYGHLAGNVCIRDFSNILRLSSDELCFVGRNGGNKFLALFENSTPEDMQKFLDRVNQRVSAHNREIENGEILFSFGKAYIPEDTVETISGLIALANSRIVK